MRLRQHFMAMGMLLAFTAPAFATMPTLTDIPHQSQMPQVEQVAQSLTQSFSGIPLDGIDEATKTIIQRNPRQAEFMAVQLFISEKCPMYEPDNEVLDSVADKNTGDVKLKTPLRFTPDEQKAAKALEPFFETHAPEGMTPGSPSVLKYECKAFGDPLVSMKIYRLSQSYRPNDSSQNSAPPVDQPSSNDTPSDNQTSTADNNEPASDRKLSISCGGTDEQRTFTSIIDKALRSQLALADRDFDRAEYKMEFIRTDDPSARKLTCHAHLVASIPPNRFAASDATVKTFPSDVTYTVQMTDDGTSFYVELTNAMPSQ